MDIENNVWWDTKKGELLENIRQTKELGTIDPEILEIMEEMLRVARLSSSLTDYYNDIMNE